MTAPPADPGGDEQLLDELSRVNNELAGMQRRLARLNRRLEVANAEKNRVLGMVAHDLRNPLGAVSGSIELILAGVCGDLSAEQAELLHRAVDQTRFMERMVSDLLDLSAIEAGTVSLDRTHFDARALAADVVADARHAAERKSIDLVLERGGRPVPMHADRRKLRQALGNLVSNALKFSPSGTTTRVRVSGGEAVRLSVQDEGPGIAAAEQAALWGAFARATARPTGGEASTGLGLAIVAKIVEAHGGRVDVASEVGRGATFTLTLPA